MDFDNHTPFPAQAFQAVDQFGQAFHVCAVRQTFSFASGELRIADVQAPLCASDMGFDDSLVGSVRQESDFVPFKPQCDVIVNATAYPPERERLKSFDVRLRMWRHGGNAALIDKTLTVHGDRELCLRSWLVRSIQWLLKWSTLTLVRPSPWRIRNAGLCKPKPVRYEQAYGGQCVVPADDPRKGRVPKKVRLTAAQAANHPDTASGRQPPLAHVAFDPNPCGTGFAQSWYLRMAQVKSVQAPSIEHSAAPLRARQFWRWLEPNRLADCQASAFRSPAGFGILPKTHPERRRLLGTVDASFIASDAALPDDFDFAIWNCAPPDQRVHYPAGSEEIELVNLCAAGAPGTRTDEGKNVCLRLRLPSDRCGLRLAHANGRESVLAMMLDTVLIEPEDTVVTLVWRRTIPMEEPEAVSATLLYQTNAEAQGERMAIGRLSVPGGDEAEHD